MTRLRVRLGDGAATTLHIASYPRDVYRPRVVVLERPEQLVQWCHAQEVRHAVVGGFFARPQHIPLGAVRVDGVDLPSVPFGSPWDTVRACLHVRDGELRIGLRNQLPDRGGDLLQAGPLLVSQGRKLIEDGVDPEGFSAGSHQFDSDITAGRYPRAALGLAALNLDGGGSASLIHRGRLRNRPREEHGADLLGGRPIVTAVIFESR